MLYPQQNAVRNRIDLSGIWQFQADPAATGDADGWALQLAAPRPMAVPGSWNEQYEDLFNYLGLGWYATECYVPGAWRGQRIMLRVGSACYHARVFINGVAVGAHDGGHLPFDCDIGAQVRWDAPNRISIAVENELRPNRVPAGNINSPIGAFASFPRTTYDFFPFAGLHRPVIPYSVPPGGIDDITVTTDIDGAAGEVAVAVRLAAPDERGGMLRLSGDGFAAEAALSFTAGVAHARIRVPQARLWSDRDPFLYQLAIHAGDDQYALPIGIRTIAVDGQQILLNGRPVQLNGFGRHEDFIASGKGLNLPLLVKDYQLMKWTGANAYRTSHYPYSDEEMQLADREGFLIIDEIPAVSLQFEDDAICAERLAVCTRQLDALIARDKNHPSVVMWCVANEPMPANLRLAGGAGSDQPDPTVARGQRFLDALVAQARALDPTRLVTVVGIMGGPAEWLAQSDVICINRYWGWYVLGGQLDQALAMLEQELDQTWQAFQRPVIVTEFGADTYAGMHGHPAVMWTEEYQAAYIRGHLAVAARKPYVAGMQVWNFADFAAVQSIMRVGGLNMKGVFTRTRTPKMAAHVLREFWSRG